MSEEWILDFDYTFHIYPNRDWFSTYENVCKGVVLIGKKEPCKIAGVGTIRIKIFDGVVRTVSNVRPVFNEQKLWNVSMCMCMMIWVRL